MGDRLQPTDLPGLVSFWDFQEPAGSPRVAKGAGAYALTEQAGPVERVDGGLFGPYAAHLNEGQWLHVRRADGPLLDLHGPEAQVTVVAWLKREKCRSNHCEAVAGIWGETDRVRQYCMFLNLGIWQSGQQVCAHVSSVGGPTPGYKYCMDAAIGETKLSYDTWTCCAMTYGGGYAKAYLDGRLDERGDRNPYQYEGGLFDGGPNGADFTVGAVHRSGEMGNFLAGTLGGLAIYNRALTADELAALAAWLPHD